MGRTAWGDPAGPRRLLAPGAALALVGGLVAGPAPRAAADEWTLQTGIHVDAWSGAGQDGHEVLAPFSLAFDTPFWGVSARGAYGTSERDPGSGPSGSITGFTATTLSGYSSLVVADTEIRAGLDLDLPTGVSRLRASQLAAVQDPDLVALDRFGRGFDINARISAYRNFGVAGFGLGVGYLRTGKFDPTRDTPNDDFDPGDELTVSVLGDFYVADLVRVLARVAYTYFTADELGGARVFREGDELDLLVTAEWRPEPWWVVVTLRDLVRSKAESLDAGGRLTTELRNSNGNDFRAGVTVGYIVSDAWTVEGAVDLRHVAANSLPRDNPLHDGGRTKVAFGPLVTWRPHRTLTVEAGVRYFVLDANESAQFPTGGTIRGVHSDVRLTYRF